MTASRSRSRIIAGDCLEVLPSLPKARMIFADPPDNLGMKYDGFVDKWPTDAHYINWLSRVVIAALDHEPDVFWLSHYWKWNFSLNGVLYADHKDILSAWDIKLFIWRFTFGQHNKHDCGSGFRPILRFSKPGTTWNTDSIRVPSARQAIYNDKRADPRGRVPDDVFEFPRVCGTHKERRKHHPNQHPEALIERMVRMSTKPGDHVIDLFGGTFTTHRVCERLSNPCTSIELSHVYCSPDNQITRKPVTSTLRQILKLHRRTGDFPMPIKRKSEKETPK